MATKSKSISFKLLASSSPEAESIIAYLEQYRSQISPSQKISEAVFNLYLPFAIPKDYEFYREAILEALTYYKAQIELLENLSGISLQNSNSDTIASSTPINLHPHLQSTSQQVANTEVQTKPINSIPATATVEVDRAESTADEIDLSDPASFTLETLEVAVNQLFEEFNQDLEAGGTGIGINRILEDLEPENDELWTEEMYELYDSFRFKMEKKLNKTR